MDTNEGGSTVDKTKAMRKGRVHYVYTSKGLFPISTLRKYEIEQAKSQQLEQQSTAWLERKGLLGHPFSPSTLLDFKENNIYFDACVRQIAKDVVTAGWRLVPKEDGKEDKAELEKGKAFLEDPNDRYESLATIIEKIVTDWGTLGWTALEHSRDPSGETNGIWHIPAQTIYVHEDKVRYAQIRGTKKRWFKAFGAKQEVSSISGDEVKTKKNAANEIIWYSNYYARSEAYGAPNVLSCSGAIIGMIGVRDYNLAFFDNFGVPAGFVTLEGEWDEDAPDTIRDFLDSEIRGSANAHKTIVLEVPEGGTATWTPLSVEMKEGSFTIWIKQLREEVLVAYRMPPYRIGIAEAGSLGGSIAKEATEIYNQSIVASLKKDLGELLTLTLLERGLGIMKYRLEFIPLDLRDFEKLSVLWDRLFGLGAINSNWVRSKIGEKEREDGRGDEYYLKSSFVSISDEPLDEVEKRERAVDAFWEDMSLTFKEKQETLQAALVAIQEQLDRRD